MSRIKLIGTTHLIPAEKIIEVIKKEKPDIIGVELCQTRFNVMVSNPRSQKQISAIQDNSLIGKISKSILDKAKEEGIQYGSDFITASRYAIEHKIPLILVDRPLEEIRFLMEKIPANEMKSFLAELTDFETKSLKENVKDVNEDETLLELKTKYPISYEFLIQSRDMFIMHRIMKAMLLYPNKKIIIFLGKGHIDKISKELNIEGDKI